jgi:hypothetical protein
MSIDAIPTWALFVGTIALVMVASEAGYLLGNAVHRRSQDEKESPVSAMAGAHPWAGGLHADVHVRDRRRAP